MREISSLGLTLSMVVAMTAAAAGTHAPPATATTVDINCLSNDSNSYSPGLTLTLRETTLVADGDLFLCESSDPAITSGTNHAVVHGELSCTGGSASGPSVYTWNTGETSVAQITAAVALRPAGGYVVVATGTITAGKFAGDTLLSELFGTPDELAGCLTSGVEHSTGTKVVTFTDTGS